MTSKSKAIEALRELCKSSHCVSESLRLSLKPFEVTERKNIIYEYINQPTLDDCIAVVEKMKNSQRIIDWKSKTVIVENVGINNEQYDTITEYEAILEYEYIFDLVITAIKGLKEGK